MNTFHQDVWEMENASLYSDQTWLNWLKQVSKISGIDNLDGDETEGDKYSLDSAYEAFTAGQSPKQYAGKIV